MKFKIPEEKLIKHIQNFIDFSLKSIREESEDWGLGEMHELEVLNSLNRIEIDRIVAITKIKVYINMYLNYYYDDMDELRSEIQYKLEDWIPNVELYINQLYDLNGNSYEFNDLQEENNYLFSEQTEPVSVMPKSNYKSDNPEPDPVSLMFFDPEETKGPKLISVPPNKKFSITKQQIIKPLPFPTNFVSNFGQKRSYEIHPGVDIAVPSGTEIKSPLDGIIQTANINLNSLCGGAVDIIHPGGYWTRFCHVKEINVVTGQKVKQGDVVGLSGGGKSDTGKGKSSGPHLHWTLKLNDVKVDASKHIGKEVKIYTSLS